jgi:hypothetical protein
MSTHPGVIEERGMKISRAQRQTAGTDHIRSQNPHTMEIVVTDGSNPRVIDFAGKLVGGFGKGRAPTTRS